MTTPTMRERLARAVCRARGIDPDAPGDEPPAPNWIDFLDDVDAILAELREPDASVLGAGADFYSAYNSDLVDTGALEAAFTAMIDAIRKEC